MSKSFTSGVCLVQSGLSADPGQVLVPKCEEFISELLVILNKT